MSTPTSPALLRRAAQRRVRRRINAAVSAATLATVAVIGTAVVLAAHSATPPPPTSSPSAGPQPSSSPQSSSSPRHSPGPDGAPCENVDLTMGTVGGDGFAGGSVSGYSLTNHSNRTCSLSGFISTRYTDGQGRPVTVTSQHDGPSRKITLGPGRIGYFQTTVKNPNWHD
jgi:Domain of unknown function (DUF4232)